MTQLLAILTKIGPLLILLERLEKAGDSTKPLIRLLAKIPSIWDEVEGIVGDGELSDNECDALGRDIAGRIDIRVRVNGIDVVDEFTEVRFCRFVVRLARNTIRARLA